MDAFRECYFAYFTPNFSPCSLHDGNYESRFIYGSYSIVQIKSLRQPEDESHCLYKFSIDLYMGVNVSAHINLALVGGECLA